MTQWSKEDLEEMCGDDVIDQLVFLAGCNKHRYSNCKVIPDGWIIPDESLRKFAELIVRECINTLEFHGFDDAIPYVKWMATNKLGQHFGVEDDSL